MAENLTYFKLYANNMYFGMLPQCNLPTLPKLHTLIVGNMSFANNDQIDWILSHKETLEELILDDAMVGIGAKFYEEGIDLDGRRVIYSPLQTLNGRPSYQPSRTFTKQTWLWSIRWHHVFARLQKGLPRLQHFAFGHGNWDEHVAYDEADALTSTLVAARYQFLDRGTGPDNWLRADNSKKAYNDWEDDEEDIVHQPDCDDEDSRALQELLNAVQRRW
ncbi:unnamed protein product [Aureobasidium vineae]|uniref:Uncharacterized protein n=1 Tax=Aureobasidium vineae TaxID=2773715 RepID=A0A9N8JTC1_9PEZI|nr:unnamed protein product [Aureobasidium vineae]